LGAWIVGRLVAEAESVDPDADAEVELEAGGSEEEEAAAVGEELGGDDEGTEAAAELESWDGGDEGGEDELLETCWSSTSIGLAAEVAGREAEFERERLRPRGREDCFASLLCLRRLDLLAERETPFAGGRLSLEADHVTIVDCKVNR